MKYSVILAVLSFFKLLSRIKEADETCRSKRNTGTRKIGMGIREEYNRRRRREINEGKRIGEEPLKKVLKKGRMKLEKMGGEDDEVLGDQMGCLIASSLG